MKTDRQSLVPFGKPTKANGHALDCMCEDCVGSAGAGNPIKLPESRSLIPFRKRKQPEVVARVRMGPPTPGLRDTWEVAVDDYPLAVFNAVERNNAVDFANGFNLGRRWRRG